MKIESKYLIFWSAVLLFSLFYGALALMKFSSLSVEHIVRSCVNGVSSLIHFSSDILPLLMMPAIGLLVLAMTLKLLFSYVKITAKLTRLSCQQMKRLPIKIRSILLNHDVQPKEVLVVNSRQPFAYTIGMLSPKIVLSSALISLLPKRELEAVLLHEQYHQRHLHTVLLFVGEVVTPIFFLLPIFDDILSRMKVRFEVEADNFVLLHQKTARHLLTSLRVVTSSPITRFQPGFATYALEDRIQLLTSRSARVQPIAVRQIVISLLMVLISLVLITLPVSADSAAKAQSGQQCEGSFITPSMSSSINTH
jgi:beta-lactamase regulating signal transducer with metallopeptidase domain